MLLFYFIFRVFCTKQRRKKPESSDVASAICVCRRVTWPTGQVTVVNQKGKKKKGASPRATSCFFLLLSLKKKKKKLVITFLHRKIHKYSFCSGLPLWLLLDWPLTSVQAEDKERRCVSHRDLWCLTYWQRSPLDEKDSKRLSSLDFGTM